MKQKTLFQGKLSEIPLPAHFIGLFNLFIWSKVISSSVANYVYGTPQVNRYKLLIDEELYLRNIYVLVIHDKSA